MPIDVDAALSEKARTHEIAWTTRDVLLYHLSLGASRSGDPADLVYTYEQDLCVLPTFAIVAGGGISSGEREAPELSHPGLDLDMRRVLHGGQSLRVHREIPSTGQAVVDSRVVNVWDKGKAAVIEMQNHVTDPDGADLWTATMLIWARGEGGFGGDPGPSSSARIPEREPDAVVDTVTGPETALLYRLNGDLNPLHADPEFARMAGFDRPILHGLASYGIAAKAVADQYASDGRRVTGLDVRFAGPMWPGETLRTSLWNDGDDVALAATCPERDDAPVLTHARATLSRV